MAMPKIRCHDCRRNKDVHHFYALTYSPNKRYGFLTQVATCQACRDDTAQQTASKEEARLI